MNISLDVDKGKWRHLTASEIDEINRLVEVSAKTNY